MVARRSSSDSGLAGNGETLREALAACEAKVEALRERLAGQVAAGGGFLAEAAHAIRSPLTIAHSYLEILTTDLGEGLTDEQRSYLGIAYQNTARLRRLVDDLVDLAALETGTAQVELAPHEIGPLVAAAADERRPSAESRGLDLSTDLGAGLPEIRIDASRMTDVLHRLIDNSIRCTPEDGSIVLLTRATAGAVVIEIRDSGIGMPADRIEEAFGAFVQLHRKPGENRESYGLGLPLSRLQITAMGGTLEMESGEQGGTVLTIRIPFEDGN